MFKTLFKVADVLYRINYGGQKTMEATAIFITQGKIELLTKKLVTKKGGGQEIQKNRVL